MNNPEHRPVVPGQGKPDIGKRAIAFIIDAAIAGVLGSIPAVGGLLGGAYMLSRDGLDFDFMKHRSVGKHLMKLRVLRNDGSPMDIVTSVKRNWMFAIGLIILGLMFIPFLGWALIPLVAIAAPILLIIEAVLAYNDPQGLRWGDRLAGTRVIESND